MDVCYSRSLASALLFSPCKWHPVFQNTVTILLFIESWSPTMIRCEYLAVADGSLCRLLVLFCFALLVDRSTSNMVAGSSCHFEKS